MSFFKKSQIGIFVIIALVILVTGILYFSFSSNSLFIFSDSDPTFQVKEFIDSCLTTKANEAVNLLGVTGGWLYHPEMTFAKRDQIELINRRAQGMNFFNVDIPYWFYFDDSNQNFVMNIPKYDDPSDPYSMKSQLERHIEDNIFEECFYEFEEFSDRFEFEYRRDTLNIESSFTNERIQVNMDFPILIKEKNTNIENSYSRYTTTIDNHLYIPYNLAIDIIEAQSKSYFLEYNILGFITPYQSSQSRDLLPPFYEFRLEFDFAPWIIEDVKNLFKNILNAHISQVRFLETSVDESLDLPVELDSSEFARNIQNIYTRYYITEHSKIAESNPRLFDSFKDFKVTPTYYQFFPTYFSIAPSLGNTILFPNPDSFINVLPFFYTEYVSVYEITAPILIEIRKDVGEFALDNFVFNVLIETNIDFNSPLGTIDEERFSSSFVDLRDDSQNTLICDPFQFISAPITFNITDPIDFGKRELRGNTVGVDSAVITFNCAGLATCFIGQTTSENTITGSKSLVNLSLPINCPNGVLEISKFGHEKLVIENVNPDLFNPIDLGEFEMPSGKDIDLVIKKVSSSANRFSIGSTLNTNEEGYLIFSDVNDQDNIVVLSLDYFNKDDLSGRIRPGFYDIEGFIFDNSNFTIPSERVCFNSGLFSEDCETLPEINFSSWITGSINYKNFEISNEKLIQENTLVIPFREILKPNNYDELGDETFSVSDNEELNSGFIPYFDY